MTDREDLFEKRFLGTLTPAEAEELKRLLREDVDAPRDFVRYTQERAVLVQLSGRRAEQARRPRRLEGSRGRSTWILGGAAAAALLIVTGLIASRPPAAPPPRPPSEARKTPPNVPAPPPLPNPAPVPAPDPAVERPAPEALAAVEKEAREAKERQAAEEKRRRAAEELAAVEAARQKAAAPALEKERERLAALQKPAPPPSTLASVATLENVQGDVILTAGDERLPGAAGKPVLSGQGVAALGLGASATLAYADGTRIELAAETVVQDVVENAGKSLFVTRGAVTATVAKQPAGAFLRIRTPQGEAAVLGTKLRVAVDATSTRVEVRDGKVRLSRASDKKAVDIPAGQYAVASPKSDMVARPLFPARLEVGFDAMPAWSDVHDAKWGSPAAWTLSARALQASRTMPGSSARTLVLDIPADTLIEVSAAMKCPKDAGDYHAEFGFRLGSHPAESFVASPGDWVIVTKFARDGVNGNGNQTTRYAAQVHTGGFRKITVGFKQGSTTPEAPVVAWDALRIGY